MGPRPKIARREAFDVIDRLRIRRHIVDRLGIDLDGSLRNGGDEAPLQGMPWDDAG